MSDKAADLPLDERAFTEELFGAELFWARNKTTILAASVAVVVALAAAGLWIARDISQKREAERVFALADGPDGWEEVVRRFPQTPPAEAAALLLAASLRKEGDLAGSSRAYEEFLKNSEKSPLSGLARLGIAQNALAGGEQEQALEEFRLTAATGDPFAAPMALFLEARALVSANQFAEARKALDSLTTQFPDSLPARFAPSQIQQLDLVEPGRN